MALPESILVRYTEEEAANVSVRPVVRQTFQLHDLLDMVLGVTGKNMARVQQILRSGTVVYHFYRYWWTGFEADEAELSAALAAFPDADASRPFDAEQCVLAVFESGGVIPRHLLELRRAEGSKRRMFRGQSFWERLLEIAGNEKVSYQSYSYGRRADLYRLDLDGENVLQIAQAAKSLARGDLRAELGVLSVAECIFFVCPRSGNIRQPQILQVEKDQ
jgi:hypothetical protein